MSKRRKPRKNQPGPGAGFKPVGKPPHDLNPTPGYIVHIAESEARRVFERWMNEGRHVALVWGSFSDRLFVLGAGWVCGNLGRYTGVEHAMVMVDARWVVTMAGFPRERYSSEEFAAAMTRATDELGLPAWGACRGSGNVAMQILAGEDEEDASREAVTALFGRWLNGEILDSPQQIAAYKLINGTDDESTEGGAR